MLKTGALITVIWSNDPYARWASIHNFISNHKSCNSMHISHPSKMIYKLYIPCLYMY